MEVSHYTSRERRDPGAGILGACDLSGVDGGNLTVDPLQELKQA